MHAHVQPVTDDLPHAAANDEANRESTRPIRALNRGLEVLTALNKLERAAINTLAASVRLPRTTTYRILETLRLGGYVERDAHDDCYRPTIMVRALSDGFDDEAMPFVDAPLNPGASDQPEHRQRQGDRRQKRPLRQAWIRLLPEETPEAGISVQAKMVRV